MSNASELAKLASTISVTNRGGEEGANTVAVDSFSVKKLTITDGRSGNGTFDGGNTAYPSIELISSGMSTTAKYTPSIKFGSTDAQFITQNPKFGAAIVAEATQNYTTDTTGGMALSFWTSPIGPGVETSLRERVAIESSGQITVNNSGFLAWTNSQLLFTTTGQGQGARIGKFSDNDLYIENFDDADIIFRNEARPAGHMMIMHGANGNVSITNSLTIENDLYANANVNISSSLVSTDVYVERDLYFDSGYGSTAKAYGCRAWVSFYGGLIPGPPAAFGGVIFIHKSGNVTSITDLAVGTYRVNFQTPMSDTRYAMCGSTGGVSQDNLFAIMSDDLNVARTVNDITLHVSYVNGAGGRYDTDTVNIVFFR